jgi:tetratricopeptide repeat protein
MARYIGGTVLAPPRLGSALAAPIGLGLGLGLGVLLAVAPACGGRARVRGAPARPAEVLVEVLPRSASVTLDGNPLPPGGGTVPAPPEGDGAHVLAAAAEGYEPVERSLLDGDLAGARVAEVLRPRGFAAARALDYDDAEGLVLAAGFLARQGRGPDAVEYAERAVAIAPGAPETWRALGDAAARAGDGRRAAAAWTEYLRLAPQAPDAAEVAARIDETREDVAR